jgi:hypothetical protein
VTARPPALGGLIFADTKQVTGGFLVVNRCTFWLGLAVVRVAARPRLSRWGKRPGVLRGDEAARCLLAAAAGVEPGPVSSSRAAAALIDQGADVERCWRDSCGICDGGAMGEGAYRPHTLGRVCWCDGPNGCRVAIAFRLWPW